MGNRGLALKVGSRSTKLPIGDDDLYIRKDVYKLTKKSGSVLTALNLTDNCSVSMHQEQFNSKFIKVHSDHFDIGMAMMMACQGHKVSREAWETGVHLFYDEGTDSVRCDMTGKGVDLITWMPYQEDLLKDDYYVVIEAE